MPGLHFLAAVDALVLEIGEVSPTEYQHQSRTEQRMKYITGVDAC